MKKTLIMLSTAVAVLFTPLVLVAQEHELIEHVAARRVPELSFKRISEFFDQTENTGGKLILRTEPKKRAGYYFIISLHRNAAEALADSSIELHYFKQGENLHILETYQIPESIPNSKEIWLGLTGGSTVTADESILAWNIVVRAADGRVLDSKQSFLWQ